MKIKLNRRNLFTSLLTLSIFFLLVSSAQATITNPVIGEMGSNEGVEDGSKFTNYIVYLWKVIINLGALTVIAYFIWGAIEWITAGSDAKKTENARTRMANAIIGLVILVSSFTILSFISKIFFGDSFDLLRLTLPTQESDPSIDMSQRSRGYNYNDGFLEIPATVTPKPETNKK